MGLIDELSGKLNRGAEITARTGRSIKLKAQLGERKSQRSAAFMRLGEAVYAAYRENPQGFESFEDLAQKIAGIDADIACIQMELDRVAADAAASARTYMVGICNGCGYRVAQGDAFCSRCGKKVEAHAADGAAPGGAPGGVDAQDGQVIDVDPVVESDQPAADGEPR